VTLLLVLVGGAVGAPTRYLTDLVVQRWHGTKFPWGTWTVNVVGSLILGVVAEARPPRGVTQAGARVCGGRATV
jgi:CrcB protein